MFGSYFFCSLFLVKTVEIPIQKLLKLRLIKCETRGLDRCFAVLLESIVVTVLPSLKRKKTTIRRKRIMHMQYAIRRIPRNALQYTNIFRN